MAASARRQRVIRFGNHLLRAAERVTSATAVPDASSPPPLAPRLWSLDALRGSCALIVFLNHWHLWSGFAPQGRLQEAIRNGGDSLYAILHAVSWPTGGHHP